MARVLLVDGTNLLFRSHFALISNPLVNSKKVDVSVPFQFTKTLCRLISSVNPTHATIVFDPPDGSAARRALYPQYKTSRSPTPENIVASRPVVERMLRWMGLCTVSFPGHEGDDTIASICQAMVKRDRHITIFSSDKDFCQLLQHGVDILKPRSGSLKYATITESSFQHEFGLSPSQFVDMTALMGDKVPTSL